MMPLETAIEPNAGGDVISNAVSGDPLPEADRAGGRVGPASSGRAETYGSFWIEKTEFALPVNAIQEVVNEPLGFTPVPLSSPYMIGLFNLRGMIIPVIDLRILLEFPKPDQGFSRKVAVIENGDARIGLLFDDTGGVISSEGATRVNFETNAQGVKDVVVEGVLKFDNGQRMVQILDPFELLKIEKVPKAAAPASKSAQHNKVGQRLNCITFQLGHTICAIDLRYVQEITEIASVQKSQLAHGAILGNINLRGHTLPIVDFRSVIGREKPFDLPLEALKSRKLLVLSLPEGLIGLVVYSIDSILSYFESDILPFAKVAIPRHDIVAGCLISPNDEIVILLDHEKLMRDEELVSAARSCKEIYPPEHEAATETKKRSFSERKTFIVFSIEKRLAMDISCVCEILNRPEKLLTPPYALHFVEGILNLRGELITLVDLRDLYGFPAAEIADQKVLIFRQAGQKYGIVVDTADEIVTVDKSQIMDIPSIRQEETNRAISEDVKGCLQTPGRGPDGDPTMILNVDALIARCAEAGIRT